MAELFESILGNLQGKLGKKTIKRASDVARPKTKFEVQQIKIFNEFNKRNPRTKFAKAGLVDKANKVKAGDDLGRGIAQRLKGKQIKYIASGMGDTPLTEYNTLKEAMRRGFENGGPISEEDFPKLLNPFRPSGQKPGLSDYDDDVFDYDYEIPMGGKMKKPKKKKKKKDRKDYSDGGRVYLYDRLK